MTTQFTKLFSFILANVHDPAPPLEPAYRMQCHSCMSPYLEDQFMYISHLYRRPLAFTEKCDFNNFDGKYMRTKNCSDLCVSLRMHDKVGGRRRYGYMRGCMSDIIHYNRSVLREFPSCYPVRLRDLFVSSDRYAFDPHDQIELCPCHKPFCNAASGTRPSPMLVLFALAVFSTILPKVTTGGGGGAVLPLTQESTSSDDAVCTRKRARRLQRTRRAKYSVLEIGVS